VLLAQEIAQDLLRVLGSRLLRQLAVDARDGELVVARLAEPAGHRDADRQAVGFAPRTRLLPELLVLGGERRARRAPRIHALGVGPDGRPEAVVAGRDHRPELLLGVSPAETVPVARERFASSELRPLPPRAAAEEVHLVEAVLALHVPLGPPGVLRGFGEDVRDAPGVAIDLDLGFPALQGRPLVGLGP